MVESRARRWIGWLVWVPLLLRVWHTLVLRTNLDEPLTVAVALIGGLAVFVVLIRPTRIQLAFGLLLAVMLFVFHWGYERAASDGREYFAQVHSLVFDRDLDFTNDNAVLGARGAARMYPFGLAVLWAPFMVLAHVWLTILNWFGGDYAVDGFMNPYQRAVGLGTLLYGFAGIVLMWRIVRDFTGEWLAFWTTLAAVAGTFGLWYLVVENSMSHGVSMFAATLFFYVWYAGRPRKWGTPPPRWAATPSRWWLALGLTAGVMTMVRWQNALLAIVPISAGLWGAFRRRESAGRAVGLLAASAFVGVFPQLLFWKVVRGGWISLPAADHGWDPTSLHVADVLMSSNHGLFSTTPLALVAVIGLLWLFKRDLLLASALSIGFGLQVFSNSALGDWWGGPAFGARLFDGCMLVFAAGLAGALMWMRARPLAVPGLLLAAFVGLNVFLMIDVRSGALPPAGPITFRSMAGAIYKRLGNPFVFPYNAYIAWKYDADWSLFDRLEGRTFNNIEIDFGLPGDEMFLGNGWLQPQLTGTSSIRWASGSSAAIVVPLKASAPYKIDFTCTPVNRPTGCGRRSRSW